MRYLSLLALSVLLMAATGCGPAADTAGNGSGNSESDKNSLAFNDGELKLGEPIRHENLEIFPVLSDKPKTDDLYITLDEGLKSGVIEIREVGGANNDSNLPNANPTNSNPINDDIIIDLNPSESDDQVPSPPAPAENPQSIPPPPADPLEPPAAPAEEAPAEEAPVEDPFDADAVEELNGIFGESAEAAAQPAQVDAQTAPISQADEDEFAGLYDDLEPAPAPSAATDEDEEFLQQVEAQRGNLEGNQQVQVDQSFPQTGNLLNNDLNQIQQTNNFQQAGGNQVNRVIVVNNGDKPLYLMPGEIIIGGDQDRTIGRELVIAPDGKPVEVDVFCVEQGRWGNRGELTLNDAQTVASFAALQSSTALVPSDDLVQLGDGSDKFVGSVGNLSSKARLAVQHSKDQSQVWDEVGKLNAKNPVQRDSSAFTANYTEADNVESLVPYIEKLQKPIQDQQQIVGVVVAINGKPVTADVFNSTPLFQKLWPKLLKSYALEAATSRLGEDGKPIKATGCPTVHACDFITGAYTAPVTGEETKDRVAVSTRENQNLITFRAATESEDAEAAPSDIHVNAIAK